MSDSTADQDRIERDLARTRSRMDERLNELQSRLSPGQILDDMMNYFRGSDGAEFGRNLMHSVRENPLPAALTGVGLVWLMASNGSGGAAATARHTTSQWATTADLERHIQVSERAVQRRAGEADTDFSRRVEDARGAALGVMRDAADTAESYGKRLSDAYEQAKSSIADTARDAMQGMRDTMQGAREQIGERSGQLADKAMEGTRQLREASAGIASAIGDNPMVLGAIALAAGAMLGALVPTSRQEEEALGGVAARARDSAMDMAKDAVSTGAEAARSALDAGQKGVAEMGLADKTLGTLADEAASGKLGDKVVEVARNVMQSGEDALHGHGAATPPAATPTAAPTGQPGQPGQPGRPSQPSQPSQPSPGGSRTQR